MCSFMWAPILGKHGEKLQNFVPFHQHQHGQQPTKLVFKSVRVSQLSEGPQQKTPMTISPTADHFSLYSRVFCVKATNTAEISTQDPEKWAAPPLAQSQAPLIQLCIFNTSM